MAITKILNIQESDGRNPASHLKNALEYIQNPDKTEECVLVGSINCLPDTAFEQMEETKKICIRFIHTKQVTMVIVFSFPQILSTIKQINDGCKHIVIVGLQFLDFIACRKIA